MRPYWNDRGRAILSLLVALALLAATLPLPAAAGSAPAAPQAANTLAPLSGEQVRGDIFGWGPGVTMGSSLGGTFIYSGQETEASVPASGFKFYKDASQYQSGRR